MGRDKDTLPYKKNHKSPPDMPLTEWNFLHSFVIHTFTHAQEEAKRFDASVIR
jgi:hypothetical protein